ncbi:MAG: AAA family ATPase [Gammaproteobacteria bacterium]|nr:AAA family ATPase [Gammaproteobacteria bacterium]
MGWSMDPDLVDMATKAFPAGPDRVSLYPAAGQIRVLNALQQDAAAGLHLLCVTGPVGSGKTVLLRALRQSLSHALAGLVEKPTPGRLLVDVARALKLNAMNDDESFLRRHLVKMLSLAEKQNRPIVLIVDDAEHLSSDDLDLLLHFFPRGHATLVFSSATDPETWLPFATNACEPVAIDRTYHLEPLSANETADYIRHRLREAAVSDILFQPATVAAIHQESVGLPGLINQCCSEELAQGGPPKSEAASTAAPTPEPKPEPQPESQPEPQPESQPEPQPESQPEPQPEPRLELKGELEPISWPDPVISFESPALAAVPVITAGLRKNPVSSSKHIPPADEDEALVMAGRLSSLRRSKKRWRAVAILASAVLAAVLTKEVWVDRVPFIVASLQGVTDRAADQLALKFFGPVAEQSLASSVPDAQARPEAQEEGSHNAEFAALDTPPPLLDGDRSATFIPRPISAPLPEPVTEVSVAEEPVTEEAVVKASVKETPPLSAGQRAEVARLYAERAEYEWHKGELASAAISIRNGLATDPGNQRLLEMQARLQESIQAR